MYYNWRHIEGYNAPVVVVIGGRGIGKTFGKVKESIEKFIDKQEQFIYVCNTLEDVKMLSMNKGEKFFASLKKYYEENKNERNEKYYNFLFGENKTMIDTENQNEKISSFIYGGVFKINGLTGGYLLSLNQFSSIKRNNFPSVKRIIIDEFIEENIDIRYLKNPYKIVSVVNSVARLRKVKIYMLANSVRADDIILTKLGLANMKQGEIRKIKDEFGLLLVAEMVDMNKYQEYKTLSDSSVGGRFAKLLGEDNLLNNEFKTELSNDLLLKYPLKSNFLLFSLTDKTYSIRVHLTADRDLMYILSDYGKTKNRITFEEKVADSFIQYQPYWIDSVLNYYNKGKIRFESEIIFKYFKKLLKLV